MLKKIENAWGDLPLTNSWDSVLDEGISKGCVNWQMYGSQKPGNEAYRLKHYLIAEFDPADSEWITTPKKLEDFDLSKHLDLLSAQYDKHLKLEIHPRIKEEYDRRVTEGTKRGKKSVISGTGGIRKKRVNLVIEDEDEEDDGTIKLADIINADMLKKAVDNMMNSLTIQEQNIKEIHEYTQILPEKYYNPGSHVLNRQVAFALKHTDERLFLSWVMLRSKAADFDYSTIPGLYVDWKKYYNNKKEEGVTKRSIMYWAKQDAFEEYEKVKKTTIDYYIEETIFEAGEWDYAMVLYHMFKDKYVCADITHKRWYVFREHRWQKDEGQRLRMAISKELFQLYSNKQNQYLADAQAYEASSDEHEKIQRKIKKIAEICIKLKKTVDKNNIMREAMEIFYDKEFIRNMDANPYLMCFTNGVFDFKKKEFRHGYPEDYATKSTNIAYVPYNYDDSKQVADEVMHFIETLFPKPELCRYMWDHLSASLIGIKKEHTFNIYKGSGSNGKSILTDLMTQALGEYKGIVPITLVTEKRGSIGGTSSEVMQLKGVRYAVMQEPSKNMSLNEGRLKELTGADPIQARALYCESETFIPQFSLVVCLNELLGVYSNDDGTWRRMKVVDFMSKFISEGEYHMDDTEYVYIKDKSLKEKLPTYAPVFISMLVKRVCETEGEVIDCDEVIAASNKYRHSQDVVSGFINEKLVKEDGPGITRANLNSVFKEWFHANSGGQKAPSMTELIESIEKRFKMKFGLKKLMGINWVPVDD